MNMCKHLSIVGLAATALFAGQALATVCPTAPQTGVQTQGGPVCIAPVGTDGAGSGLQDQLDSMTVSGPGIDVYNNQSTPSAYWQIGATGHSENNILLEIAGNANTNTFGIFDPSDPGNVLELFSGNAGSGWSTSLGIIGNTYTATYFDQNGVYAGQAQASFGASVFGYYLGTEAYGLFYSDASMNEAGGNTYPDGMSHMVAFAGDGENTINNGQHTGVFLPNEFILAWEDSPWSNSDLDYNDFVVMVESVRPVPEPAVLGMFGFGVLLVGAGVALRRRRMSNV